MSTLFNFSIESEDYSIGLYSINNPDFPDIVYPSLRKNVNGTWVEIDKREPLWSDLQEDFTPERMASLIINDFNKTLAEQGGGSLTWNEKLAEIFQMHLEVVGNQLVIK